jgi:hypothetical protein
MNCSNMIVGPTVTAIGMAAPRPRPFSAVTAVMARGLKILIVFMTFAALAAFPVASPSRADGIDWSVSKEMNPRPAKLELTPVDRGNAYEIWAGVISSSYGVTVGFVGALYERGYDFGEIALLLELSEASGKKPPDIVVLRKKGHGWGVIAKSLGVHPSALERAKGNESLFRRYVLAERLALYYGLPDDEGLILLSEKGYGFGDIALAVNLCVHSGASLRDVIRTREKSPKWKGVAEKFKVSPANLRVPPAELKSRKEKEQGESKEKAKKQGSGKQKTTTEKTGGSVKKAPESKRPDGCPQSCKKKCWES